MNTLRYYRLQAKLTQKQLATKSGVPLQSIKNFEVERRLLCTANVVTVYKLAKVLNLSVDRLIARDLEKHLQKLKEEENAKVEEATE